VTESSHKLLAQRITSEHDTCNFGHNHDYFRNYLSSAHFPRHSYKMPLTNDSVDHKTKTFANQFRDVLSVSAAYPHKIPSSGLRPDKFADKFKAATAAKLPAINQTIKKNAPQNESSQRHLLKSACWQRRVPKKPKNRLGSELGCLQWNKMWVNLLKYGFSIYIAA